MSYDPNFRLEDALVLDNAQPGRIDAALQVAIAVFSMAAIYLISTDGPLHRWGFVVGLLGQPFWFAATWRARQWGMLLLTIFYTGAFAQGIAIRF